MEYTDLAKLKPFRTILLKGSPGSGKTYKAGHFPNPVFFDFDHNLHGLNMLPPEIKSKVRIVDPAMKANVKLKGTQVWDNFIDQLGQVASDPSVNTIVIDSLTTLQEFLLDKILGSSVPSTAVQIQHWGAMVRYWKHFAEEVLCNPTLDKHVIICAHERILEDETSGVKVLRFALNLGGSMKDSFDLYFSDVWRTYVDVSKSGSPKYMVATEPNKSYTAKRSLEMPPTFEWDLIKNKLLEKIA
ncbi:MAG: AAA family ATPase [Leptolyngbyaceae cyanobacterium RM2_2_4]|nr:AAA family ATPase [Leptolyngbyaceae cyanobacterium RM2_2_4]